MYLLDTCVISELVARQPNAAVLTWLESADEHQLYLSAITIGEIQRGIARLPDTDRRRQLNAWLTDALLTRFKGKVLSLDAAVMLTWGTLVAGLEGAGRSLPAMDSLIAALARHHDLAVVTRNEKDFAGTGLMIINPWNQTSG